MADKLVAPTSLAVSGGTFIGGVLSLSDVAMITGILGTFLTLYLTWYFKKRTEIREQELHRLDLEIRQAELDKLKKGGSCDA
jgi:hypothetical protein